jgi:Ni2+-binding GTPase involved in maturation of urease and hydrogenase
MKIHLIGGFLGSGKTTVITAAAKLLIGEGVRCSIITNDQGRYLVDSKYIQGFGIPGKEVTGGCFCCNYNQLDSFISTLKAQVNPELIFAESVGSCTDLVATVLKPLLKFRKDIDQLSFSTLADAQLLFRYLQNQPMPFDADTSYIWEKQLEESEILVLNKIDLLSLEEFQLFRNLVQNSFSSKVLLFQNSLDNASVKKWIEAIHSAPPLMEHKTIAVDYNKYGKGEANLAWLDQSIEFMSDNNSALRAAGQFIDDLVNSVWSKPLPVGHLKFLLSYNNQSQKLSYSTIPLNDRQRINVSEPCNRVHLMVNARIQALPGELRSLVVDAVNRIRSECHIEIAESHVSFFRPGFPKPTYRFSE